MKTPSTLAEQWISSEIALPADATKVIMVTAEDGSDPHIQIGNYWPKQDKWFVESDWVDRCLVPYWMPFPDVPYELLDE